MTVILSTLFSVPYTSNHKMVLITGDGRNVGKTWFACQLIQYLSKNHKVTGIKTSPHLHAFQHDDHVVYQDEKCIIIEEKKINSKDSSLMLQAGAEKVFFIMAQQEDLERAYNMLDKELDGSIIVAESGGLNEFIKPGKFIFIKDHNTKIKKQQYLKFDPQIITRNGSEFSITVEEAIQGMDFQINEVEL